MKLTAQDVIRIHEDLIKSQSISPGYKSKDDIYSLIDKLDSKIFGIRIYDTPFKKGAALFEGIIRLHPFIDGNKRTALASLQQYMSNEGVFTYHPVERSKTMYKDCPKP